MFMIAWFVFEEHFTTDKGDKHNLMYSIEAHEENHKSINKNKSINDETNSGGARPLS